MAQILQYQCPSELLAVVEAAFAASGYHVELMAANLGEFDSAVITQGTTNVLLSHRRGDAEAVIEIAGPASCHAAALLEALPIPLAKQPAPHLEEQPIQRN